jgi:hypothetical protein
MKKIAITFVLLLTHVIYIKQKIRIFLFFRSAASHDKGTQDSLQSITCISEKTKKVISVGKRLLFFSSLSAGWDAFMTRDVPRPRPNRDRESRFRSVSVCLGLSRSRSVSVSVSLGLGLSRSRLVSVSVARSKSRLSRPRSRSRSQT